MVSEMMNHWIIKASQSPFASLVILVNEKDNIWRMYVDYRQLNELTIKKISTNNRGRAIGWGSYLS